MREYDLPMLVIDMPKVTYNEQDSGLYLQGAVNPLLTIKIEEKPEGYAVLTAPNFYDVADDPDFVSAGPIDIIIQNAIGFHISEQVATRRIAGISGIYSLMPQTGYYVISADEEQETGQLSAQIIRTACKQQSLTLIKEQLIVCEQANGLMCRGVVSVYKK